MSKDSNRVGAREHDDDSAYNRGSFRADRLLNLVTTESKTFVKINPDKWFFPADISICECEGEMTGRNI
jgi:hypothetical protein